MDEVLDAHRSNRVGGHSSRSDRISSLSLRQLLEMFGAGTACIVCPVERIVYEGKTHDLATMSKGNVSLTNERTNERRFVSLGAPITNRFHDELVDIQVRSLGRNRSIDSRASLVWSKIKSMVGEYLLKLLFHINNLILIDDTLLVFCFCMRA